MHHAFVSGKHQRGASGLMILIVLAMVAVISMVAFKIYPAYYEHWQIMGVVESFDDENALAELSERDIERQFSTRLQTNNIRNFDMDENLTIDLSDDFLAMELKYEVRVNIYRNIDAVMSFEETYEKRL